MSKKPLLLTLSTLIILGVILVIFSLSPKKETSLNNTLPGTQIELSQSIDWEPQHWFGEFPTESPESAITLETYEDGSARLLFDHKVHLEGRPAIEEKLGTFQLSDDAKSLIVTLGEGYNYATDKPYTLPKGTETLVFALGTDEIIATQYDRDVYPYAGITLKILTEDERYFYGDPTKLLLDL